MNILVTGGAGFIGSHIVDALIERGHRVRVLDALVEQVHGGAGPQHLNPNAEFLKGDVCDPELVDRALEGVDVVYHKAAEVGVGQSMYEIARYVKANDFGTAVLLEAIVKRRPQIQKLVVASSMSIYGEGAYACDDCGPVQPKLRTLPQLLDRDWEINCPQCGAKARPVSTNEDKPLIPSSVYAISKQDQEQFCLVVGRAYDIPVVALRYFNVYGPHQALSNPYTGVCAIFSGRLLNDEAPMVFEDGEQTRDFVHVSDIVQANMLALETDKADYQALNIGTGFPISISEIALMLARGLGKDIRPEVTGKYREGDIRHCVADISRARTLLGYEPKVKLADGIPELLEWVRQQQAENTTQATAELEQHQLVR
ncbi:MAG TPA: NAD-dependent epimerase/dehydratase family protein [Pyrinomonadaceae bacterium]|jgi:dTDP-L-rhamnose 4-epimerase|nr:NAD-dependent epimerase/dehydratase family protein [Pyrinomonadaceae bacterium]